jgi:hypothetical protein
MSCEEYPPASTIEGGALAVCSCVAVIANSLYGLNTLGIGIGWIENGKHKGFKFWVEITGIDCAAVTPTQLYPCNV